MGFPVLLLELEDWAQFQLQNNMKEHRKNVEGPEEPVSIAEHGFPAAELRNAGAWQLNLYEMERFIGLTLTWLNHRNLRWSSVP